MSTRKYNKTAPYWNKPRKEKDNISIVPSASAPVQAPHEQVFAFDDNLHYSAGAACGGGTGTSANRDQYGGALVDNTAYRNIRSGLVPFEDKSGTLSVKTAIELTYLTYFNYALLRNAINLLVDFSVGKISVKTSNVRVRKFITQWLETIGINQIQSQFFLELYRSGNVFLYKTNGRISDENFDLLKQVFSAKSPIIPIRYNILNPMQISLQLGADAPNSYVRMLSRFEIARLKSPQTNEDRQVLESFPEAIQNQIKKGSGFTNIFVPLDPTRLYYVFYRKQDYEPMAVPMAFPVLNDIEQKLEMKRMDMALSRTIEQVILLITTGQKADQYNQATGVKNIGIIQELFRNQTLGRVFVADHTTKAEWAIPDLKGLLGPEKYQRVDQDIKEGLQYMFFGEEKFANASIKAKIFMESLKEGRRAFLENFLIPELKKVCAAMNFKNLPELEFDDINIEDETLKNRVYVQMAQLGLLTPDQLINALESGVLPDPDDLIESQQAFKAQKDKGLFFPLIGGTDPNADGGNGRPAGPGGADKKIKTPIGKTRASVEEDNVERSSKYAFGMTRIAENLVAMNGLKDRVEKALCKKWKLKELNDAQASVAMTIAKAIALNKESGDEKAIIARYLNEPKDIDAKIIQELNDIGFEFDTDPWISAILYKSKM